LRPSPQINERHSRLHKLNKITSWEC
jgi:hypothetical protein